MYQPLILSYNLTFVRRDSLLFCFCGGCEQQLTWVPQGGGKFKATHCHFVYQADPEDIDMKRYLVVGRKSDDSNVTPLFKKKPERMTFA